ncbi:Epoxide hydrolase 4 [Oryzias melastigma]|uniref:Epoxide hydrolase 4 n=1 Tax=Oryzias melastigma TaxID=30732 RepID=A0A834F5M7_ORYME|nr:Epoxide hydrolase 4 [Oryzias melastigma]
MTRLWERTVMFGSRSLASGFTMLQQGREESHSCCFCTVSPEFWFSWRYQLREFKSEFRVVAIDMRGYGESDLPLSADSYCFEYLVTDVKDIVEYLGYNRCYVVGHDWGGTIAWLFAIHYPEMVTKLIVLNCPHPTVFTDYALRHPSQLLKCSHFFFFQLPRFPELMLSINDFKVVCCVWVWAASRSRLCVHVSVDNHAC